MKPILNLNKHPKDCENLSLVEAENHYDCFKSFLGLAYEEGKLDEYTYEELVRYNILIDDKMVV